MAQAQNTKHDHLGVLAGGTRFLSLRNPSRSPTIRSLRQVQTVFVEPSFPVLGFSLWGRDAPLAIPLKLQPALSDMFACFWSVKCMCHTC